jgi:hypothetical protein
MMLHARLMEISDVRDMLAQVVRGEPVAQRALEDAQDAFEAMCEQASESGLTLAEVIKAVFNPVFEYKQICECPSCSHRRAAAAGQIPMDAVRSAFTS